MRAIKRGQMKTGLLNWWEVFLVCNSLTDRRASEMSVAEADGIDYCLVPYLSDVHKSFV